MVCSHFAASRCLHGPYLHTERVVARQKSLRSAGSVSHAIVAPPTRQPWPCHVVIGHPIIHGCRKLLPFAVRIKLRCIGLLSIPVGHAACSQSKFREQGTGSPSPSRQAKRAQRCTRHSLATPSQRWSAICHSHKPLTTRITNRTS